MSTPNPVFGNNPFAEQIGGCGERGRVIHVPYDYLNLVSAPTLNAKHSTREAAKLAQETRGISEPGRSFVHEWAKYRYGVFEEYGYPGDERFPMFHTKSQFTSQGIVSEIVPNYCVDEPLKGSRV